MIAPFVTNATLLNILQHEMHESDWDNIECDDDGMSQKMTFIIEHY